MYCKLTVPPVNSGYTDKDGKVSVQGYYVFVNDENKNIESALVTLNKDNSFTVLLPTESLIDYANRITVWFFVYAISLVTFPEARQCPHGRRCLWN